MKRQNFTRAKRVKALARERVGSPMPSNVIRSRKDRERTKPNWLVEAEEVDEIAGRDKKGVNA